MAVPATDPSPGRPDSLASATKWPVVLTQTCQVLARTAPGGIAALSVFCSLGGAPGEWEYLVTLSAHLAREYGLKSAVTPERRGMTVRFSRDED